MKTVVIVVALLAVAGGGYAFRDRLFAGDEQAAAEAATESLYTVSRGTLKVTITENGTLVAKDSKTVDSDLDGDAKITFLVDEGTLVKEGDIICELDDTEYRDELEKMELDIMAANAELETARTELEIQEAENESEIEKAEIAADKAVKELERYQEGDAPKERRNLDVAIKDAQTTYGRDRKRYEDSQGLFEKTYINRTQLEDDQIKFEKAEVNLEGAQRDLELFETYTFPMTLIERQAAVRETKRSLETARKRAESRLMQRQVTLDEKDSRLKKLQTRKERLEEQIGKMILRAPVPGLVIHGNPRRRWDRDRIRVGGEIWGSFTVATIPDLRVMQVKLRIHESDISKVVEGQTAKVSMDTYAGLVMDGEVTRIARIASGDNQWEDNPEVKKFDVEVTLAAAEEGVELKPGISAKAEIFIEEKSDVLYVPLQCVFVEDGAHWCYVMGDTGPARVEVTPGISNDNYIEIVAGVDEGAQVLLYNPNLPTSGEVEDEDEEGAGGDGDGDEGAGGGSAVTE